ncbi:hypothetical protein G7046_g559 [Stylonectria norvegica]|nr:hypothetical protein G7046_g559 [Stylonectria norvegica]
MPQHSSQNSNPPNHAPLAPTYSHISTTTLCTSSKLIAIAGQVGHNSATGETPAAYVSQIELALSNLAQCLRTAGATTQHIIQVRQYIVNLPAQDSRARAELYLNFMGDHRPPATVIGVDCLAKEDLLYEIEVLAVVNEP